MQFTCRSSFVSIILFCNTYISVGWTIQIGDTLLYVMCLVNNYFRRHFLAKSSWTLWVERRDQSMVARHRQLLLKMKTEQPRTPLHQDKVPCTQRERPLLLDQDKSLIKWWLVKSDSILDTQTRDFNRQDIQGAITP